MAEWNQRQELSYMTDSIPINTSIISSSSNNEDIGKSPIQKDINSQNKTSEVGNQYVYSRTKPKSYAFMHMKKKLKDKNNKTCNDTNSIDGKTLNSPKREIQFSSRASTLSNQDIILTDDNGERESTWNYTSQPPTQVPAHINPKVYEEYDNVYDFEPNNESFNYDYHLDEYPNEYNDMENSNTPTNADLNVSYSSVGSNIRTYRSDHSTGQESNYKPYNLQDYKRIADKSNKLGGLGPDKLNNEYQEKQERAFKQQEYAKLIRQQHLKEKQRWISRNANKEANNQKQLSRAKLAAEYAKNIPRPKPAAKPKETTDNKASLTTKKGNPQTRKKSTEFSNRKVAVNSAARSFTSKHSMTISSDNLANFVQDTENADADDTKLSVIEMLKQRHERDKLAAAKIKQNLKL
ncbi:hypothetical protein TrispH2_010909 [Trichoplax sp. H2]|nr:hypothetical protein TrispH2_010909 [Trichoplax sp. H2]|eukprot:RDD36856.1 hypothetical protein TrispH2_010909 [Trichoplax sp. H2]